VNGSEVVTVQRPQNSGVSYAQNNELTDIEKMNLAVLHQDPRVKTLYKLMELEIVDARNEAMEADPAETAKQLSLMTVAHAMDKFYKHVRSRIEFSVAEHIADIKSKALQEELKDQEKLNDVILYNQTH